MTKTTIPTPAELERAEARVKRSATGGGYYDIAGRRVRGKVAAAAAIRELDESGPNPGLSATTKKTLDSMTESHRRWVERFEIALGDGGGLSGADHVWAATRRARGRSPGPVYLAVKFGPRDYRLVSFDESEPTTEATELGIESASPSGILVAFKSYRALAKDERAASKS